MIRHTILLSLGLLAGLVAIGCGEGEAPDTEVEQAAARSPAAGMGEKDVAAAPTASLAITLTSPTLGEGGAIPKTSTCDGGDVSPRLTWKGEPDGTVTLALILDDPDAPGGDFVHWVMYDIPPNTDLSVPQGEGDIWANADKSRLALGGIRQLRNGFGGFGYSGPCPPAGEAHRYIFKLYALDTEIQLEREATKEDLLAAMDGHILAQGQLVGTYAREQ